jgi:hypothetical protein
MINFQCLTNAHFALIWEARTRFPQWAPTANELIVDIAGHLPAVSLAELWNSKLSTMPIETTEAVALVRHFSAIAIRACTLSRDRIAAHRSSAAPARASSTDAAASLDAADLEQKKKRPKWFGIELLWCAIEQVRFSLVNMTKYFTILRNLLNYYLLMVTFVFISII